MFFPCRDFLYESTLNLSDIIENSTNSGQKIPSTNSHLKCPDCKDEYFICYSGENTQNDGENRNFSRYSICPNALHFSENHKIILLNRYRLVEGSGALGYGNFTSVFLIQDSFLGFQDHFYALKVVRKDLSLILENEFKTLTFLLNRKPHLIPKPFRFFSSSRFCFLIQEILTPLLPFPTHSSRLEKLNLIRSLIKDLSTTLFHLHFQQITHADLKLSNLMYRNSSFAPIKFQLIDFGNCLRPEPSSSTLLIEPSEINSPIYRPPELLALDPGEEYNITNSVDIWAFGILLLDFCSQGYPFGPQTLKSFSESDIKNKILQMREGEKRRRYAILERITKLNDLYFIDLLDRMLSLDFNDRISAKEILNHPFLLSPF
jgi:serine/threonine protein kinase